MQDPPQPGTSSPAGPVQDNPKGKFNIFQEPGGDQSIMQTIKSTRIRSQITESNSSILQNSEYTIPIGHALQGADANAHSAPSYKATTLPVFNYKANSQDNSSTPHPAPSSNFPASVSEARHITHRRDAAGRKPGEARTSEHGNTRSFQVPRQRAPWQCLQPTMTAQTC